MTKFIFFISTLLISYSLFAQETNKPFTHADTLRGTLTPERSCYDVTYYHLDIKVDTAAKSIAGKNTIQFKVVTAFNRMQVDLFSNLNVDKIVYGGKELKYNRDGNAVFIDFPQKLPAKSVQSIDFFYSGVPVVAARPPWSGGFTWAHDEQGKPWINTTCQEMGASVWWPNKDHQTEKPDSMLISIAVPSNLMDVSNGQYRGKKELGDGYTRYDWFVSYPINNYCVALNIGNYVHFDDKYGTMPLDYYVLPYNLEKAKKQFAQVKPMLGCFEKYFGEYPFKRDGYKIIETTHSGMEHQSAVGYGNYYENGYRRRDWTGVGVSMWFDFIIIHESGHEWFGNSITSKDIADMWLHEGFTTYAEAVYVECLFGYDNALKYINGYRGKVANDKPILGPYGVNTPGSKDMYFKGALFLHTLRNIINDDTKWWALIKDYYNTFKHQIIDNKQTVAFFTKKSGKDLTPLFEQYLNYKDIPVLELQVKGGKLMYRWKADVKAFNMPVKIALKDKAPAFIYPTTTWKEMKLTEALTQENIKVATDLFFVNVAWL
ncbi:M1 family metallopeptidase [Cytophagaceae bacterium DM2B3-1]|uniref:M1 family metallopeptidase n=1 Tax=Xanthocytophaga flava TaxID=3048013 RepID=A0ABT7CTE1_9BACT|nr:M1 family metallopeptidase [Xanthocytophaga flavus]MDJ1496946.1 M1 family metallopeptidase [Xanthocytophaga flavus]